MGYRIPQCVPFFSLWLQKSAFGHPIGTSLTRVWLICITSAKRLKKKAIRPRKPEKTAWRGFLALFLLIYPNHGPIMGRCLNVSSRTSPL
jgi:hypothetical protein